MIDLANCRYTYRGMRCLVPQCRSLETAYCHHPHHRGMGSGKAGWAYDEGVPLCWRHHDELDARGGAGSVAWAQHLATLHIVECLAPPFWARIRAQAEAEAEAVHRLAEADEAACER